MVNKRRRERLEAIRRAERKKEKTPKGECLGSTEHPGLLTPEGVMLESMKPHLNKEIKVDHDCGVGVE